MVFVPEVSAVGASPWKGKWGELQDTDNTGDTDERCTSAAALLLSFRTYTLYVPVAVLGLPSAFRSLAPADEWKGPSSSETINCFLVTDTCEHWIKPQTLLVTVAYRSSQIVGLVHGEGDSAS